MRALLRSDTLNISYDSNNDPIHLYTQFFIPTHKPDTTNVVNNMKNMLHVNNDSNTTGINNDRYNEIKFCLRKNVENEHVD